VHHDVIITPSAVMDALESFAGVFAQPGPQPHYQIHTLIASQQIAADGFTHVFTGDGADAVFLGYPTVSQRARLVQRLGRVPAPVARAGSALLRSKFADRHLGHVGRTARASLDNLGMDAPARGHLPTRLLDDHALARLRLGPAPVQGESVKDIRNRLATGLGDHDPVRLAFHGHGLTGQSRVKVDGAVAATGVTQSTPFKHPLVRDWVASLPVDFLRTPGAPSAGAGKELLVAMVRRYDMVPEAIISQPKQSPSDSPIDTWYAGELRPRVLALLDQLPFAWDRNYVDEILAPKRAEELFRHKVSISHHAFQVIGLLASYASFAAVPTTSRTRR
jgi:asparagine synthetase B (glutamine-hydrolysing)